MTGPVTDNRAYPVPDEEAHLVDDRPRLVEALAMIDADVAQLILDLAGKTGLNSPAFTGTPTAPTPTGGDSTNKIATTAFVAAAIAVFHTALVGAAPAALDTIHELAAALDNDADFAAALIAGLADRVRVDAPQSFSPEEKAQGQANLGLEAMTIDGGTFT